MDNPMLFSIGVILAISVIAVTFQKLLKERWGGVAVAILIPVAFTVVLNHVLAERRDREGRRWTLRQDHVRRLKPMMQTDAAKLAEVAQRMDDEGRLTGFSREPIPNALQIDARFSPDPLSGDVINHYATYAEQKQRLRDDVEQQDREYTELVLRVLPRLRLPSDHAYRETLARAVVWKCVGIGPGMTFESDDKHHNYSWLGGGGGGGGPAPREVHEAWQAFQIFRLDVNATAQCATLRARRAKITDHARKLSAEARMLAERTTLVGDCIYTRLE